MPRSNPELAVEMGMRMSARRRELGLTQEMVADLAGIAHQQYNKAENGKSYGNLLHLVANYLIFIPGFIIWTIFIKFVWVICPNFHHLFV